MAFERPWPPKLCLLVGIWELFYVLFRVGGFNGFVHPSLAKTYFLQFWHPLWLPIFHAFCGHGVPNNIFTVFAGFGSLWGASLAPPVPEGCLGGGPGVVREPAFDCFG